MRIRNLSCPYCKKKTTRDKMVNHIEYNHSDQLPEGFTALRMTFHIANNRPIEYRRPCRVCGNPTEWDEKKGRYNFLCGNPVCKEKYVAKMKADMGEKYGAYRPTATAEGLEKMLAARRISGKYKWSDGSVFNYTGSYELETLKFMDKVLEIKSEDLMVPGPVLEYEYKDEKHLYITDMYYRPYNLIIEVKDGGSSVNKNKEYGETRAKQMAKEKYVIQKTNYNYIRLTDKDMSQLMVVFGDLKYHLVDNDPERVIHVNESEIKHSEIFESNYLEECDKKYNLNLLDEFGKNIMWLSGLTGSGKSTLGRDLKENCNFKHVCLDNVSKFYIDNHDERYIKTHFVNSLEESCPEAVEFFELHHRGSYDSNIPINKTHEIQREFCDWFVEKFSGNGELYVIEGDILTELYDIKWFAEQPVVIKQNSYKTICERRSLRECAYSGRDDKLGKHIDLNLNNIKLKELYEYYISFCNQMDILTTENFIEKTSFFKWDQLLENTPIASIAPVVGFNPDKDVVLINYTKKKTFVDDSDYAIADSPKFDTVYSRDNDGYLKKSDKSILLGSFYTPYIVRGRREQIVEALYDNKDKVVSRNFIYETTFGHPMYSKNQLQYESCEEYEDYYQGLKNIKESFLLEVSEDMSVIDKDFKKKTDKTFIFKDINDSSINKLLKKDNHIKGLIEWYRKAGRKGEVSICKEDDIITGYIIVNKEGKIGPLYISKKYRGYGASNTLVNDAVNKFGGKELGVYKDNEIAIRLYKKFGFKKKETSTEEKTGEKYLKMVKESYIEESNKIEEVSEPYFIRSKDGVDNACVNIRNYSKPFRARSSMIILRKQGNKVYVYLRKNKGDEIKRNGKYSVPGGGWEKGERPIDAAIREAQEEARINVDEVRFCGTLLEYHDTVAKWVKDNVENPNDWWYGYYSKIYVGFYAGKFNGHIDERDKETEFIKDADFYAYEDVILDLPGPYADAIDMYINGNYVKEDTEMGIYGHKFDDLRSDLHPELLNEKATEKDIARNQKLSPIFVVNTFTGTWDGKMIRKAAGMKYSHALISLSPRLSPMYSFDEADIPDPKDPKKTTKYKGLVVDNFERYKREMGFGDLRVICIMVTNETKKKIREAIQYYLDRIDQTKYSYKKLVGYIVGSKEVNSFGDMAMVCSEFVDSILKYAKIDISGKSSSNTKPDDLATFKDRNNFFQIYEGKISKYDPKKTEGKIENMKQTIEYKNLKSQTKKSMKNMYDHELGRENLIPGMAKRAGKAVADKAGSVKNSVKKKILKEDGTFEYVDDIEFFEE